MSEEELVDYLREQKDAADAARREYVSGLTPPLSEEEAARVNELNRTALQALGAYLEAVNKRKNQ